MSKAINRETQALFRQEVMRVTSDAAMADKVSVQADALAFLSQPPLFVVNAPIAGIEKLDFKAMLNGQPILDNTPVMYWYFPDGSFGKGKSPVAEGFYTVVAHEQQGTVSLRDAHGKTIAEGDLGISIGPPDPSAVALKIGTSGGIDSVKLGKGSLKVCGHVTVSAGPASVTVSGCVEVHF